MKIQARFLGLQSYSLLLRDMRRFTTERDQRTTDEIWVVEHPPVFTRGQRESDGDVSSIEVNGMGPVPVIASDRGGLITYHGPGQMIFYVLIDLKRSGVGIRRLVAALEQAIIDLLRAYGIAGSRIQGAPGVYVDDSKIASLGLRVRNGCTYHGLSLNVDMNMAPFGEIDPCGVPGQKMTLLRALGVEDSFELIAEKVCRGLSERLGYTVYSEIRPTHGDDSEDPGLASSEQQSAWPALAKPVISAAKPTPNPDVHEQAPQGSAGDDSVPSMLDSMKRSATNQTTGRATRLPEDTASDPVITPPGSNLLSHLTSLGQKPAPVQSAKPAVQKDNDDLAATERLRLRRLVSVNERSRDRVHDPEQSSKFEIPSEIEQILKSELSDIELPRQPNTSDDAHDEVSPPKISMAKFVRSDDDLEFLKPSNLHELIKDSDKDS